MLRSALFIGLISAFLAASLWIVRLVETNEDIPEPLGPQRGMSSLERARRAERQRPPTTGGEPSSRQVGERIMGLVLNDQGRTVPFFRSWVLRPAEFEAVEGTAFEQRPGQSSPDIHPIDGRDGRLVIFGLEPGPWKLRVAARGHVARTLDVLVPLEEPIELELQRAASVAGRVELAGGVPAVGAEVGIGPRNGGLRWFDVDAMGSFKVDNLVPGTIDVTARVKGREELASPLSIGLDSGEQRVGLVLQLRAQGRLSGELLDTIKRRARRGVLARRLAGGEPHRTETDAQGRFAFTLPVGNYLVMLDWNDNPRDSDAWVRAYANRWEVSTQVEVGTESHVRLGEASPTAVLVQGQVKSAAATVASALVSAYAEGQVRATTVARTNHQGRFEFTLPAPGRYDFTVGSATMGVLLFPQQVPSRTYNVTLRLPQGGVRGSVRAAGRPLEGAVVKLFRAGPLEGTARTYPRITRSDTQGHFAIDHLAPGVYHMRAFGPESGRGGLGMTWLPDLVIDEQRTLRDLRVLLEPAAAVRGVVRDARGAPIEGARVLLRDEEGRAILPAGSFQTDDQGRFSCTGLGRGIVHLRVESEAGTGERRLVLQPAKELSIQMRL